MHKTSKFIQIRGALKENIVYSAGATTENISHGEK